MPGVHCGTRLLTEDPRRSSPVVASGTLEIGFVTRWDPIWRYHLPTRCGGDWRPVAAHLRSRGGRIVVCVNLRKFQKIPNLAKDRCLPSFGACESSVVAFDHLVTKPQLVLSFADPRILSSMTLRNRGILTHPIVSTSKFFKI